MYCVLCIVYCVMCFHEALTMIIEDDNLVDFVEITNKYKDQNDCNCLEQYGNLNAFLLYHAIEEGSVKILKHLLQFNSINQVLKDGRTLLHMAVIDNYNRKTIKLLLSYKPNLNIEDKFGKTVLVLAAEHRNEKIVKLLLKSAAYSNQKIINKETPLFLAVVTCNREITKLLLKYNADPNKKEPDGRSVLHHAATEKGDGETVKLLLKYGADPNKEDNYGKTALYFAAILKRKRVFFILYEITDKKYKYDQSILKLIKINNWSNEILLKNSINIILQSYEFDTTSLFSQDYLCRDLLFLILNQAKNEEILIRCEKKINKENNTSDNP